MSDTQCDLEKSAKGGDIVSCADGTHVVIRVGDDTVIRHMGSGMVWTCLHWVDYENDGALHWGGNAWHFQYAGHTLEDDTA